MKVSNGIITGALAFVLSTLPIFAQPAEIAAALRPGAKSITVLNTVEGRGGKARAPGSRLKFIEESKGGTAPKFIVKDENGVKWIVKLGSEAKPETAATRLVRAAGYIADEDYYRAQIRVEGLKPLERGKKYVGDGGLVRGARLERVNEGKTEAWSWHKTRPADMREFNGLRIMMALINNWDLKSSNNSASDQGDGKLRFYVSDLGASFGRTGSTFNRSRGVMEDYAESKFVKKVRPEHVDFVMRSRPFFLLAVWPKYYIERTRMEKVARRIPIEDARRLGFRLGQLSPQQIGDCFRDAGFSPAEVEGYTRVVLQRIDTLKKL